jgi:hypothetical protein
MGVPKLDDGQSVLPCQVQARGSAGCEGLGRQQARNRWLIETECVPVLVALHLAFVVLLDHPIKDEVEKVSVEDCDSEDIAYVIERVDTYSKA